MHSARPHAPAQSALATSVQFRPADGRVATLRADARAFAALLRARPDRSRLRFADLATRLERLVAQDVDDETWCREVRDYITPRDAWDLAVESHAYGSLVADWSGVGGKRSAMLRLMADRHAEAERGRRLVLALLEASATPAVRAPLSPPPASGPYARRESA